MSSQKPSDLFSTRLRAALEIVDMSQTDLAKRAGLQPSAVSHFASGARTPSFDNLCRVADALGVSTDYLVGRSDAPTAVTYGVGTSGADQLAGLTNEQRDIVKDFVRVLVKRSRG